MTDDRDMPPDDLFKIARSEIENAVKEQILLQIESNRFSFYALCLFIAGCLFTLAIIMLQSGFKEITVVSLFAVLWTGVFAAIGVCLTIWYKIGRKVPRLERCRKDLEQACENKNKDPVLGRHYLGRLMEAVKYEP